MNNKINKFLVGKCEEVLAAFPDKSINFVLTSPPYADQRVYGTKEFTISPSDYVEYSSNAKSFNINTARKQSSASTKIFDTFIDAFIFAISLAISITTHLELILLKK